MSGLVHSQETEISILSHFAVLGPINDKGYVSCLRKFLGVNVPDLIRGRFAAKPVTNIVGVAIDERHADAIVEDHFELVEEVWIREITRLLKGVENIVIRLRVVKINAESLLDIGQVEEVVEILWWSWILVGMTDIIYTAPTVCVIRLFNVGAALVRGLSLLTVYF